MELVLGIVIAALALLALIWLVSRRLGARSNHKRIRRDKLQSVVEGHREMAEAHASSVEDLEPEALGHREAAADHARIADELEERIERERRHARFHADRAVETEQDHERI
jgi:hypothetical protein